MTILYIGDVMAEMGLTTLEKILPKLRQEQTIDAIIAQAENVADGRGIRLADFERLRKMGVDFCTAGNWTLTHPEIIPLLEDPSSPIIRPANYPAGTPGLGYKYLATPKGRVLVISLLGKVVGRDADKATDNPLQVVDAILDSQAKEKYTACVVNFHGDYSSEKVIIGHYLDGRVSMVVGDHWHVPTADARILPGGTAHITDVGMCGALNSSLGIALESVIPRWRNGQKTANQVVHNGPSQFNAALVRVGENRLAESIETIRKVVDI